MEYCTRFYQSLLLIGYVYAHVVNRHLGRHAQLVMHTVLILLPFLVLPIAIPAWWMPPPTASPFAWVLGTLAVAVGLPFFVVSTTSPLLQSWFVRTRQQTDKDPYFLYTASNAGSMVALLSYPFVVQPRASLLTQSWLWTGGYGVFVALMLVLAVLTWREEGSSIVEVDDDDVPQPSLTEGEVDQGWTSLLSVRRRVRWLLLAFAPSSLMLSVTTYLTTTIAPIPLLWVVPLALYLLTFIWVFSPVPSPSWRVLGWVLAFVLPTLILCIGMMAVGTVRLLMPLHLVVFFVVALFCHGKLAQDRPPVRYLTEFYFWLSLGGVLGGMFSAVLAPLLFHSLFEYPLVLILTAGLVSWKESEPDSQERRRDVQLPLVLGGIVCVAIGVGGWLGKSGEVVNISLLLGLWVLVCFAFSTRPLRFALGLGALLCASALFSRTDQLVLATERSFFGISAVKLDASQQYHLLIHGTTTHGVQSLNPLRSREPLSYYSLTGPIGQLFAAFDGNLAGRRVAVVGLGTGSLACYRKPDQQWTFYEIDSTIVRFARDPRYFTFLQDCAPQADIVIGDARLSLAAAPAGFYDLIILDAYSSDAIPIHLLTREALAVYLSKLKENGMIAFHVSNVFFDLVPVVGNLAHDAGLAALVQVDTAISGAEKEQGKYPSVWVIVARHAVDLLLLKSNERWKELQSAPELPLWTDDFSNILSVMRRRRLL